jgi:hypothetical protein
MEPNIKKLKKFVVIILIDILNLINLDIIGLLDNNLISLIVSNLPKISSPWYGHNFVKKITIK